MSSWPPVMEVVGVGCNRDGGGSCTAAWASWASCAEGRTRGTATWMSWAEGTEAVGEDVVCGRNERQLERHPDAHQNLLETEDKMSSMSPMARNSGSGGGDEEEEDSQTLLHHRSPKPVHHSTFEIGSEIGTDRRGGGGGPCTTRCFLFVVILSLLSLLIYFSVDRLDRMQKSELEALSLLRDQQLGLLTLLNHTPDSNELKPALLKQVELNADIQKSLFLSHTPGLLDDTVDSTLLGSVPEMCRKVDLPADRRTIEWKPKKDRYLLAICLSGQMSNHLICLEKHMLVAALLERVLIFPSPEFDYEYGKVLDMEHINDCFDRKVVMLFSEFSEMKKGRMRIDRFMCYVSSPPCYLDEEHIKRLKDLGLSLGEMNVAWDDGANSGVQKKRVAEDVIDKFSSDDEVLAIGEMFYADLEEKWLMQPGGPLAHKCKNVIQPSRLIILTAQRFVQTFLGGNYIALHFRRHGFLKFCNLKNESCFYPVPQAAQCILRVIEKLNSPVIYLSTDADESETNLLQSLLVLNGKAVPLVKRPNHTSVEKWDALLYRKNLGGDNQVEAILDKTICAMSSVFIGSSGSTFTDDIFRIRRGWGAASHCDEYLCRGELPNYIAELD